MCASLQMCHCAERGARIELYFLGENLHDAEERKRTDDHCGGRKKVLLGKDDLHLPTLQTKIPLPDFILRIKQPTPNFRVSPVDRGSPATVSPRQLRLGDRRIFNIYSRKPKERKRVKQHSTSPPSPISASLTLWVLVVASPAWSCLCVSIITNVITTKSKSGVQPGWIRRRDFRSPAYRAPEVDVHVYRVTSSFEPTRVSWRFIQSPRLTQRLKNTQNAPDAFHHLPSVL
ncbi:uncharacterized protein BT62DRAFT_1070712 [Guyanagaster necrorhizus]|uniref:Uncharacterized protein n=1 Tax=Guyanagaster necrorhizus TaxID=856835 RepID=A0A9P8B0F0_9AGAR|nr:uncharacterized protein BT62DRAFT_1070712 [Guyanagaster necrorhizus MCA 3950]KAG7453022.1 hypothetical protein BT62DRAFT_1070712 [Guyanagaster necrorhizus MCA 3950]